MTTKQFVKITLLTACCNGVEASLYDRGNGMIYDDVLNVTWLQDTNYAKTSGYDADGGMTWADAKSWAANLSYGGYDDWRLPSLTPVNGTSFQYGITNNGSTDVGYNNSGINTELGYMYYVNLGNLGYCSTAGVCPQPGYSFPPNASFTDAATSTVKSFTNLDGGEYWFGVTRDAPIDFLGMAFFTDNGLQRWDSVDEAFGLSWAVRDGDVSAVPLPAAIWLFGSALAGMGVIGRRKA